MDINCLQVMNSLYNLGLAEAEFKSISDEISHSEKTGFSIRAVKGDRVIGVSHDDNHTIIIKGKNEFKVGVKPNTRVLFKTLITFDGLPDEVYTLHTISHYRRLDAEIKHTANNIEELKEMILDRFSRKYGQIVLAERDYMNEFKGFDGNKREKVKDRRMKLMTKQLQAIYWLFGEKYDFCFKQMRKNVATIVKVFSGKNTRLAIIQLNEEFEKNNFYWQETCNGIKLIAQSYKPNDVRYDYVCEGREIYINDNKEIWVCDEVSGQISDKEFRLLLDRVSDNSYQILTKERYEMEKDSLRIEVMMTRKKELEEKGRKALIRKIKEQFENGKVVRHGITITPESVSYNGVTVSGDKMREYVEFAELPMRETLDFQNVAIGYIDYLLDKEKEISYSDRNDKILIKFRGKADLTIGNIKICVEKEERNNCFFINNCKIRRDEISEAILRALSFSSQGEYNAWLKGVSRSSLRLENALKSGITFKFILDKSDDNCLIEHTGNFSFTLILRKIGNKVFVSINNKDYKVQDINALFSLQKRPDVSRIQESMLNRTIKLLYRGIKDISPKEIGEVISTAQIEYNERLKRSEDFLTKAIMLSKAKSVKGGWVVQGESQIEYLVETNLTVHKMKNGEKDAYLCIMDTETYGEQDEAQRNDRIAKRLLGLRHDLTIAKDIWNLGDKVDKWWRDIQVQEKPIEVLV